MDIIGISETGSGKTLAFLLPMIQHVLAQTELAEVAGGPIGLVIAPTRELAIQIFIAAHPFCKAVGLNAACLSGGDNLHQQKLELSNGIDIAVCTPGRLIQHIEEKNTDLSRSTFIVFDEADRLFDLGFGPQINSIIDNCRPDRQTLMFSATFETLPEKFARKALQNPLKLVVGTTKVPANITQRFVTLQEHEILSIYPCMQDLCKIRLLQEQDIVDQNPYIFHRDYKFFGKTYITLVDNLDLSIHQDIVDMMQK
uniref:Helicase ATP-binding domain-containing protein n=1 Tax=Panagrolaimus sp. ES5 TaxID=591445 RepID=A0AC34FDB8_9BILA